MPVASDSVTTLRPLPRWGAPVAEQLGAGRERELARLLDQDPIVNVTLSSRLAAARSLTPGILGGSVVAVRDAGGDLAGAAFHGGNLLPVGGDADAWLALAHEVGRSRRCCTSIVGRAEAVAVMWPVLERQWGRARGVRADQPMLVLDDAGGLPAGHLGVRRVQPGESERYVHAAAAMFTEELGISPLLERNGSVYRRRIAALIAAGLAFGLFADDGTVIFKADVGAVSAHTCQIQGVWVHPRLRGQGIGTAALASVLRHALTLAPTVSLYVNSFNTPARRMYDALGMRQVASLSTVLF